MLGEVGKLLGVCLFFALVGFLGYVLIAGTPLARIERSCLPTEWGGRALASVASLASPEAEARSRVVAGEITLSCQYLVYRQFYRDNYERMRAAAEAEAAAAAQGAGAEPQAVAP